MYFLRPERVPGEKTSAPALPNRLLPFSFHFFRQFFWGCMGLLTLPVLGRAVFASIAYATKRLTDTVLAMHDPAAEAGPMLFGPLLLFVALVVGRFALDGAMWFCSYHTRSPMLMRIKEEVFGYAQRRCHHEHPQRVPLRQPASRGSRARALHGRGARPAHGALSLGRAAALRAVRDGYPDVARLRGRRALCLGAPGHRRR